MSFKNGDRVVIREGPFAGHSATVVSIGENEEVVVEAEVFSRLIEWRLAESALDEDLSP